MKVCVLQTCHKSLCRIKTCKNIDACLDGVSSDQEAVLLMLHTLRRCVNDNVDLMSKDQVHKVRCRLLQLVCTDHADSVFFQNFCSSSCGVDAVSLCLKTFCNRDNILFILVFYCDDHVFMLWKTDSCSQERFIKSLIKGGSNSKTFTC